MLTTPDGTDAATTLPPISPVGAHPSGFFADCNPAQGFAGTRPMAEHFNELIVNLRALLAKGRIAPAKGDATMLWRAILGLLIIPNSVTLNVAPGGTAMPADPLAGNPFDKLSSCLTWLAGYRIAPTAYVTIQMAAGTYVEPPITIAHPDGDLIQILGGSTATTVLQFPIDNPGLTITTQLFMLANLTLKGAKSGATTPTPWLYSGLRLVSSVARVQNVTIDGFMGDGFDVDNSEVALQPGALTIQNCKYNGLNIGNFGVVRGFVGATPSTISAVNNAAVNVALDSGLLAADSVQTAGGNIGVAINGPAIVEVRLLGVDKCTNPASIQVTAGGVLSATGTGAAGNWWTWDVGGNQPQHFFASGYGFVNCLGSLATNNSTNCTPAVNTLGNVQSWIAS